MSISRYLPRLQRLQRTTLMGPNWARDLLCWCKQDLPTKWKCCSKNILCQKSKFYDSLYAAELCNRNTFYEFLYWGQNEFLPSEPLRLGSLPTPTTHYHAALLSTNTRTQRRYWELTHTPVSLTFSNSVMYLGLSHRNIRIDIMYYLLVILAIGDSESEKRFPAVVDWTLSRRCWCLARSL